MTAFTASCSSQIGEVHLHLAGIAGRALLPVFARASTRSKATILTFALILVDVDDLHHGSGRHVVLQRVDAALESLVMASQGLHYLPHDFERVGVVQRLFGRVAGGNDHGQDDVSVVFAFEAAHDAPNSLDDLHADFLGCKNMMASKLGTSTPSERQRTLERMWHLSSLVSASQASLSLRFAMSMVPSTCCTAHSMPEMSLPCSRS